MKTMNNYHKRKYAYKPNIISKSEYYPEINKIWVSDITYIRVRKEHYYLTVIIDLYSRKVIGHQLAKTLGSSELIELMKDDLSNQEINLRNLFSIVIKVYNILQKLLSPILSKIT